MSDADARFAVIDAALLEVESRLQTIAQQNAALSEMIEILGGFVARQNAMLSEKVEILGRYVAVNIDALTEHTKDGHGA